MKLISETLPGVYVATSPVLKPDTVELIEFSSKIYPLESIPNRPHLTMELPLLFNKNDTIESIKLRNITYLASLPVIQEYLEIHGVDGYQIKKPYISVSKLLAGGGGMPPHQDNKSEDSSHFICMMYLNDDYEGGEICFTKYDFCYKPKAGDILIYKANNTHEVKPVISGARYTVGYGLIDNSI